MNSKKIFIAFFLLLVLAPAIAHTGEGVGQMEYHSPASYLPVDPFPLAEYGFVIILILSLISIKFSDKMSTLHKKIVFILVAIIVASITLYAAATTVYLNVISESGGPVHWHADFEIFVCGQKYTTVKQGPPKPNEIQFAHSHDFSDTMGTAVLHHHNDDRIHAEGVIIKKSDISLAAFFKTFGGELTDDSMMLPLDDGTTKTVHNDELCNGKPAALKLYVKNGEHPQWALVEHPDEYVLSSYFETVVTGGQGDYLKIVFDSEGAPNGS